MKETPFYFNGSAYRLFGVVHDPEAESKNSGIVFCHPFAEEKLWAHRVFVNFARLLAHRGYYVLRFDYMGHGDSEGDFSDSSVQTRLADIHSAIAWLKGNRPVDRGIGLLGLRFGATLACLASEEEKSQLSSLVLWEPVTVGTRYMKEMLRINISTQSAVYRKILYNSDALVAQMKAGKTVNIDGYEMGWPLYEQSIAINLFEKAKSFKGAVLVVEINRKLSGETARLKALKETYSNASLIEVQEEPFWKEIRKYYSEAPNLFDATTAWLDKI